MIIMGRCSDNRPEWGLPIALAITNRGTTGFHVGGYVKTKEQDREYMCEITEMTRRRVQLVGLGWVEKKKCYL